MVRNNKTEIVRITQIGNSSNCLVLLDHGDEINPRLESVVNNTKRKLVLFPIVVRMFSNYKKSNHFCITLNSLKINFYCEAKVVVINTVNSRYNEVLGTVVSLRYKRSSLQAEFVISGVK